MFLTYALRKQFFRLSLKRQKWFRFQNLRKKTTNPTNYRPISRLSVLSKLLEKHVHIYLNDYLEKAATPYPFQSGLLQHCIGTSHKFLANSHE